MSSTNTNKASTCCLHCGETKGSVKENNFICADVNCFGQCLDCGRKPATREAS